jgi:hypothetical protein
MYEKYFDDWEVKPEFAKEFISLFAGWLGVEKLHKLDEVTDENWEKFNTLITVISERYEITVADRERKTCSPISNIRSVLQTRAESMGKYSSHFTQLVIPELDCVLTEEWDYTYILWHKHNGAVEAIKPFVSATGLHSFHD